MAFTYNPQGNPVQRHSQSYGGGGLAFDVVQYDAFGRQVADDATYSHNSEVYQDPVGFGGQFGYYTRRVCLC